MGVECLISSDARFRGMIRAVWWHSRVGLEMVDVGALFEWCMVWSWEVIGIWGGRWEVDEM